MKKRAIVLSLILVFLISLTPVKVFAAEGRWIKDSVGWWYQNGDGTYPASRWSYINDEWYYFDSRGYMQVGWLKYKGAWYYLSPDGAMATGWIEDKGVSYYLYQDGRMATGWNKIDDSWYYFLGGGEKATHWYKINEGWYYFGADGIMKRGWHYLGGKWYYLGVEENPDTGRMRTGWVLYNDDWYFLLPEGEMATGWIHSNKGLPERPTYYYLDVNGAWIEDYEEEPPFGPYLDKTWEDIGGDEPFNDYNGYSYYQCLPDMPYGVCTGYAGWAMTHLYGIPDYPHEYSSPEHRNAGEFVDAHRMWLLENAEYIGSATTETGEITYHDEKYKPGDIIIFNYMSDGRTGPLVKGESNPNTDYYSDEDEDYSESLYSHVAIVGSDDTEWIEDYSKGTLTASGNTLPEGQYNIHHSIKYGVVNKMSPEQFITRDVPKDTRMHARSYEIYRVLTWEPEIAEETGVGAAGSGGSECQ